MIARDAHLNIHGAQFGFTRTKGYKLLLRSTYLLQVSADEHTINSDSIIGIETSSMGIGHK